MPGLVFSIQVLYAVGVPTAERVHTMPNQPNSTLHALLKAQCTAAERRAANIGEFMGVYRAAFYECCDAYPTEYRVGSAETTLGRMQAAFITGSYNHDGKALRLACRALGIKHTRTAMEAFFNKERTK